MQVGAVKELWRYPVKSPQALPDPLELDGRRPGRAGSASARPGSRSTRIGEAILSVESKTIRCSMPSRAQPQLGIEAQPRLSAALVVHSNRHIVVYAHVEAEGEIRTGDPCWSR